MVPSAAAETMEGQSVAAPIANDDRNAVLDVGDEAGGSRSIPTTLLMIAE
jgi:hypothetical protein